MSKVTIHFKVNVLVDVIPTVFTYENEEGIVTDGSATTFVGDETTIIYTLNNSIKKTLLSFLEPVIIGNFQGDVSYDVTTVPDNGKFKDNTLIITDKGNSAESIGLRLIVQSTVTDGKEVSIQKFASPDPQIRSRYRD